MNDLIVGDYVLKGNKVFEHPNTKKEYFDVGSMELSLLMKALAESGNHPATKDKGFQEEKIEGVTHMFLVIKTPGYGDIPLHFTGRFQAGV